ncbi:zinc finger CCCH domain-containing protein 16 isoform X3 [Pyrus x bretschneideri]|nr:zinc finger CCCH domain-containing protein 16 isoform X3 [Pyrus x bretschneideri]
MWFSNSTSPIPLDLAPTNSTSPISLDLAPTKSESPTLMVLGFKTILRQKGLLILVPNRARISLLKTSGLVSPPQLQLLPHHHRNLISRPRQQIIHPKSCRSIIVDDFKHERPLWKLTCYGHWKNSPCDIAGDISYEELRAAAYDDANRGLNLQSIVERERSLLNTKLLEFENLCKPCTALPNSTLASQNPSPSASPNGFLQTAQNSVAPSVSSFTQLGTSLNTGFGPRPSAPSNNGFQQLNPLPNSSLTPSGVGTNNFLSGSVVGSQLPAATHGNGFPSNTGFINTGIIRPQTNPFATLAVSQIPSATTGQSPIVGQSTSEVEFVTNMQTEKISGNTSIWLKKIWSPGEIPEEEPPEALVEL